MDFVTIAAKAIKLVEEVKNVDSIKKATTIKNQVGLITSDKDENFGTNLINGEVKSNIDSKIKDKLDKYLDSKEMTIEATESGVAEDDSADLIDGNVDDETGRNSLNKLNEVNEANNIDVGEGRLKNHLGTEKMLDNYLDSKEAIEDNLNKSNNNSNLEIAEIYDDYETAENNGNLEDTKIGDDSEKKSLNDDEKAKIKEETNWSDEIVDAIGSMKEYEIYKKADLIEAEIDGRKCLIRNDIDMNQKDEFGRTNRERMKNGQMPITKSGENVELHHVGQKMDSPLAELTTDEHRRGGNDTVLHDKQKESEIDRNEFKKEREEHWRSRSEEQG